MPLTADVTITAGAGPSPAGACLSAMAAGTAPVAGLVAVPVTAGGQPPADPGLDSFLGVTAAELAAAYQLTGKPGEIAQTMARVGQAPVRIVFLGVGDQSARALRRAGAELGRLVTGVSESAAAVATAVAAGTAEQVEAFAEGVLLGSYAFSLKTGPAGRRDLSSLNGGPAAQVSLLASEDQQAALSRAQAICAAVALTRDLANTPSAVKSPQWLAEQAVSVTAGQGVRSRVVAGGELTEGGFGGILAVGSGSARSPALIELSYDPPGAAGHTVLVGKGITFDSGGLSLKPNDSMKLMKTDMAGGAVVIAVLSALQRLGVTHRVTGLIAAAENLPSGSAYRPSDVITQFGGRTVEVLNTDAEGRLVLADALAYADAELGPDQLIDIATLTGAARTALGSSHAALYSTSDALAAALLVAGESSGDRLWRMPLEQDYAASLESPVADLAHVARDGSPAGSIIAALFLREFTGQRDWAHLDIAGAGRATADDGELSRGATGFGTRLLLRWLAAGAG
ncbi:MAG TPA: leucyl aminopeptidase family protein [Streptosporangiaceae bacterium]|jgi:leucyl aminopeptidase